MNNARGITRANRTLNINPARDDAELHTRIQASGLFDPAVYLSLNEDVRGMGTDAWEHFCLHGLREGRNFINTDVVARLLFRLRHQLSTAKNSYIEKLTTAYNQSPSFQITPLVRAGVNVAVFLNSNGNFFMEALADLLALGLKYAGLNVARRNETSDKSENFDFRIFVAPHEFFILGEGPAWIPLIHSPNTVLYNVEQLQTPWFCQAFPFLIKAPLVLDLNFQSTEILRHAKVNAVYFAPGYLPGTVYSEPVEDVSSIELAKGYVFSAEQYVWTKSDSIESRPIDLVFFGTRSARRDVILNRLRGLADQFRFLCIYSSNHIPLTSRNYAHASTKIGCALSQRAKIVLNLHRDWLGYFEWSRIALQGIWQGACVVSEPGLPDPIFQGGVHFFEEEGRHLRELVEWLLSTKDGQDALETMRRTAYDRAQTIGSMNAAMKPVLVALEALFLARINSSLGFRQS